MNTLTLPEINPYLPYGLKVLMPDGSIVEIDTISQTSFNIKGRSWVHGMFGDIADCKPILRPMSDWNAFWNESENYTELRTLKYNRAFGFEAVEFNEYGNLLVRFTDHQPIYSLNFEGWPLMQLIFKHHFDFQDLIGQGKAIDINDVNKK